LEAVAFAARAHRGQLRKDQATPYHSHVFRVCLVLRHVFGVADVSVLTAAVLHDTIEDTTIDFDDLEDKFGRTIAGWVRELSKDKRLPHDEREKEYCEVLANAGWEVQVCKLADIYDNVLDRNTLPEAQRSRGIENARRYLGALRSNLKDEARDAWQQVAALLAELEATKPDQGAPPAGSA
jgi:guanosine-3',5'-bis(diphosphate) 3'-pyrophosphohydrolase